MAVAQPDVKANPPAAPPPLPQLFQPLQPPQPLRNGHANGIGSAGAPAPAPAPALGAGAGAGAGGFGVSVNAFGTPFGVNAAAGAVKAAAGVAVLTPPPQDAAQPVTAGLALAAGVAAGAQPQVRVFSGSESGEGGRVFHAEWRKNRYHNPTGVVYRTDLNTPQLVICDNDNHCVRSMACDSGAGELLAGSAERGHVDSEQPGDRDRGGSHYRHTHHPAPPRLDNPYGITVDPVDRSFLFTDRYAVRRVAGKVVTTLAGSATRGTRDGKGRAAQFQRPRGLLCSGDGRTLYVCDFDCIRAMDMRTRRVTTIAGNRKPHNTDGIGCRASIHHPRFMAFAPGSGDCILYITAHRAIRKLDLRTDRLSSIVLNSPWIDPCGIAVAPNGKLIVSSNAISDHTAANGLYVVDPDTGMTEVLAGTGAKGLSPAGARKTALFDGSRGLALGHLEIPRYGARDGAGNVILPNPNGGPATLLPSAELPDFVLEEKYGLWVCDGRNNAIRFVSLPQSLRKVVRPQSLFEEKYGAGPGLNFAEDNMGGKMSSAEDVARRSGTDRKTHEKRDKRDKHTRSHGAKHKHKHHRERGRDHGKGKDWCTLCCRHHHNGERCPHPRAGDRHSGSDSDSASGSSSGSESDEKSRSRHARGGGGGGDSSDDDAKRRAQRLRPQHGMEQRSLDALARRYDDLMGGKGTDLPAAADNCKGQCNPRECRRCDYIREQRLALEETWRRTYEELKDNRGGAHDHAAVQRAVTNWDAALRKHSTETQQPNAYRYWHRYTHHAHGGDCTDTCRDRCRREREWERDHRSIGEVIVDEFEDVGHAVDHWWHRFTDWLANCCGCGGVNGWCGCGTCTGCGGCGGCECCKSCGPGQCNGTWRNRNGERCENRAERRCTNGTFGVLCADCCMALQKRWPNVYPCRRHRARYHTGSGGGEKGHHHHHHAHAHTHAHEHGRTPVYVVSYDPPRSKPPAPAPMPVPVPVPAPQPPMTQSTASAPGGPNGASATATNGNGNGNGSTSASTSVSANQPKDKTKPKPESMSRGRDRRRGDGRRTRSADSSPSTSTTTASDDDVIAILPAAGPTGTAVTTAAPQVSVAGGSVAPVQPPGEVGAKAPEQPPSATAAPAATDGAAPAAPAAAGAAQTLASASASASASEWLDTAALTSSHRPHRHHHHREPNGGHFPLPHEHPATLQVQYYPAHYHHDHTHAHSRTPKKHIPHRRLSWDGPLPTTGIGRGAVVMSAADFRSLEHVIQMQFHRLSMSRRDGLRRTYNGVEDVIIRRWQECL